MSARSKVRVVIGGTPAGSLILGRRCLPHHVPDDEARALTLGFIAGEA